MPRRTHGLAVTGLALVAVVGVVIVTAERGGAGPGPGGPAGGVAVELPALDPRPWQDVTWERLDPPSMGGPLTQTAYRIVRIPGGVLVLGSDAEGVDGAERSVGSVWASSDGRSWEQHELREGVPPGDTADAYAAAGGPLGIVLAGGVCCSREEPGIWYAPTGLAFERVAVPADARRFSVRDVEAGPPGFVAVGSVAGGDPNDPDYHGAILTSPDGRTWSLVDRDAAGLLPGTLSDVAWTGEGWIAVGTHEGKDTDDGAVWRSPDGLAWERIAAADPAIGGLDEQRFERVLPIGGGLFVQGGAGTTVDRRNCEGGGLGLVVGVPGAQLARTCGWTITTHWTSVDGTTWVKAPAVAAPFDGPPLPPGPGGRRLMSYQILAGGGPGLVVVDSEGQDAAGADVVGTWVSEDGASWRPVGAPGQLFGSYLYGLVAMDRTLIGLTDRPAGDLDRIDLSIWVGTVRP